MKKVLRVVALLVLVLLSTLCFAVGCGETPHEHSYTQEVATEKYLQKEATCKQKASYFYSCECGEKGTETFEHGELGEHDYTTCVNNGDGTHTKTCSRDSSHTMTENCYGGTATCKEKAKCEGCGEEYGDLKAHDYTELKHNETEHWYECACGDKQTAQPHDYSTLKKNETEHWYECACGDKQTAQPHDYSALKKNETEHWHECACGEKSGIEGHKGGTATCTEKAKCDICGEAYGSLKDHSFTNYKYDNNAECEKDGTETARCDYGCGETDTRTKQGSALSHTYSDWIPNEDGTHYKYCTHGCGDKTTEDCTIVDGECQTCGYTTYTKGLVFTLNDEGTAYSVTDYTGSSTSVVIPSEYKGKAVTSIDYGAFEDCTSLTSVTIGNSVERIGNHAFIGCSSLTSVVIPDSAKFIAYGAFVGCSSLRYNVKEGVKYLGNNTNKYLFLLGVETDEITTVNIDTNCRTIGHYAFYDCDSLTSITIPDSVTSIGDSFYSCDSLTNVVIGNSLECIEYWAFNSCTSLKSVVMPNSVTSIGYCAFSGCTSLKNIEIPNSVISIGEGAFSGCSSLEYNVKDGLNYLGNSDNPYLYLAGAQDDAIITARIDSNCRFMNTGVFAECLSLTSVEIPGSVTCITRSAFYKCKSLKNVTIGNGVKLIEESAFAFCSALSQIVIPNSVTNIGEDVFRYSSLSSITISSSVTSIGQEAFYGCGSLSFVNFTGSIDQWSQIKFCDEWANPIYYAKKLYINNQLVTEAKITTVTKINNRAFKNCSSLTSVTIGDSVTSIGSSAFAGCSSLTSITIPNSVTNIDPGAFSGCTSLTSVNFVNPNGWRRSSKSTASGTSISSSVLSDALAAAKYLTGTYSDYYLKRS